MKRQFSKTAATAADWLWMGCVDSRRACITSAVYSIIISLAMLTIAPTFFYFYYPKLKSFTVFIYIGVVPYIGWIPMSLLLIFGTLKDWTKFAFAWTIYTTILTIINLLEICYWIRTFMELFKQGSVRPDILGIIAVYVSITLANFLCLDVVSAYRRQKLKEMNNLSPGYAAFLLEQLMTMDVSDPSLEDPRLPEMRCKQATGEGAANKTSMLDNRLVYSPESPVKTVTSVAPICRQESDSSSDKTILVIAKRRESMRSQGEDTCLSYSSRNIDRGLMSEEDGNEEEENEHISPLPHTPRRASVVLSPIRSDRRYSVVRLDNGRMGLIEQNGHQAKHDMKRASSFADRDKYQVNEKKVARKTKSYQI